MSQSVWHLHAINPAPKMMTVARNDLSRHRRYGFKKIREENSFSSWRSRSGFFLRKKKPEKSTTGRIALSEADLKTMIFVELSEG